MLFVVLAITLAFQSVTGEKEVCVEGFVMDWYCIDLGYLLDATNIVTLEEPNKHSVHCLVDVPPCYTSNFEILAKNPLGSKTKYRRAYVLDNNGKEMALKVGKKEGKKGKCTKCEGAAGAPTHGFRATVFGKVDESGSPPYKLIVSNLTVSPRFFQSNALDGCAKFIPTTLSTTSGPVQTTNPASEIVTGTPKPATTPTVSAVITTKSGFVQTTNPATGIVTGTPKQSTTPAVSAVITTESGVVQTTSATNGNSTNSTMPNKTRSQKPGLMHGSLMVICCVFMYFFNH